MICASGRARRARRIAWRAWRSASAVTAQVLTITVSSTPAISASIAADSAALSRQPKVRISLMLGSLGQRGQLADKAGRDRSGHQHVAVAQPLHGQFAAVELDDRAPARQAAQVGRDDRRAGAAPAGARDAGAALPHAQPDAVRGADLADLD